MNHSKYLTFVEDICLAVAHDIVLWAPSELNVLKKEDQSPVSDADIYANKRIVHELQRLTPNIPVISEEAEIPVFDPQGTFWLVDPIDGTSSFIIGKSSYTVNIALIEKGIAVLGVIVAPKLSLLWAGLREGANKQAYCKYLYPSPSGFVLEKQQPISVKQSSDYSQITVLSSFYRRSDFSLIPWNQRVQSIEKQGLSSSLKFCYLAQGDADAYVSQSRTKEWDTAAGQAIVEAAGGSILALTAHEGTYTHSPMLYGKENFNNGHFIALSNSFLLI